MDSSPEEKLLVLAQILGREEVTEAQAEENKRRGKGPKRARQGIKPRIKLGKSSWWEGIRSKRFPAPVRIGENSRPFWRESDIQKLISNATEGARNERNPAA